MREQFVRAWRAIQVELHGEYSDDQMLRFSRYHATTSWTRVLFVCCAVPLPCIAFTLLVGLLPLEAPENGPYKSPHVWLSQSISITQVTLCTLQQLRCHLPDFEIDRRDFFIITTFSTPTAVVSCFALATLVGYPLPFTLFVGTMPWFIVFTTLFVIRKHRHLRDRKGLLMTLARYLLFALAQINMMTLYPMYSAAYSRLSALRQTAFVLLLPVLKITFKFWISRTLPESNGGMPEAVIFNVEVFHSLFVSLCMGNSVSPRTVGALMAIDALEAWLAFHDVHGLLRQLGEKGSRSVLVASAKTVAVAPDSSMLAQGTWIRPTPISWFRPSSSSVINPFPSRDLPRQRLTGKLMYMIEFVVLIEYTEVVIPTIYNVLMLVLFHLPNRDYYSFFDGICSLSAMQHTVTNVAVYALLELASLVAMAIITWRLARISILHQLAFVLEDHAANIQAKLLLWVPYFFQNAVVQLGADYTFRFSWLRGHG